MQGMNPERYTVFEVIQLAKRRKAYLQRAVKAEEPLQYCVYIAGNGHYFKTEDEMREYLSCRRRKK